MAFGFLIERFDIFLAAMASGLRSRAPAFGEHKFANAAGLAFIFIGVAMIAIAAIRFFRIAKEIDDKETESGSGPLFDLVLAALLVLLGASLFLYLSRVILPA
jgi:putative membrane protein